MSPPRKRSVAIRGHRTSYSVEDAFLDELRRLSEQAGKPLGALIAEIDSTRPEGVNLSSAIRLHVLAELQREAEKREAGDASQGIGPESGS